MELIKNYLKSQMSTFSAAPVAKYLPLISFKLIKIPFDLELAMMLNVEECLYLKYCLVTPMFSLIFL